MTYAICKNTDGSWEYQVKWNKSDREGQDTDAPAHMWDLKLKAMNEQTNSQTPTTVRMMVTRGKGGRSKIKRAKGAEYMGMEGD